MKISVKKKSKGKTLGKIFSTVCQDYSPDMKEYIFAIKGRPFAMMSSQKLPVPPVSLIDYNLVRDLGLEVQDLQCTKYTFAGRKFRILGRVSQTLQTIQDGVIAGTAHVRANVVENLYQAFDTHSIAGQQMLAALQPSPARYDVSSPSEDSPSDLKCRISSPPLRGILKTANHPAEGSPSHLHDAESPPRHRTQPGREREVPQVQLDSATVMYGRVRSITADYRTATVDYIQKDGTISRVTAKQYPDTDVPAKEGEAVMFQQFSDLKEANRAGYDHICPVLRAYDSQEEHGLADGRDKMIPPKLTTAGYNAVKNIAAGKQMSQVCNDFMWEHYPTSMMQHYDNCPLPSSPPPATTPGSSHQAQIPTEPEDYYGRVVQVNKSDMGHLVTVDCESQGNIFSHTFYDTSTEPLPTKFRKLKVGTAVSCRQYPSLREARREGHHRDFVILQIYTKTKEEALKQHGATFPDVPPDLNPRGYYG